jgi:ABC-2 type transport system permease protein
MRWLADYMLVALIGILCVVAVAVVGAAVGIAAQGGEWSLMETVLVTGGGQVAAASTFLVITALVFAVAPRLTIPLGWMLVLLGMVLGLFGPLFGFPEWLTHVSPIAATPQIEGDEILIRGLWWIVAVVVIGAVGALTSMRRRELTADG